MLETPFILQTPLLKFIQIHIQDHNVGTCKSSHVGSFLNVLFLRRFLLPAEACISMASNLSLSPLFSFSRIDITTIQSMTSATVNASYDNERRIRPFQVLKILLVENNLLGHLLACHPLFLRKAGVLLSISAISQTFSIFHTSRKCFLSKSRDYGRNRRIMCGRIQGRIMF